MKYHYAKIIYPSHREMTALMLFHRDLRLVDHNALESIRDKNIIPLFVFTPEQVSDANPLKSNNSVQFMIESLRELEKEIIDLKEKNVRLSKSTEFLYNQLLEYDQKKIDKIVDDLWDEELKRGVK